MKIPLVYWILGLRDSGRREIAAEFVSTLLDDEAVTGEIAVWLSERELPDPTEARWQSEPRVNVRRLPFGAQGTLTLPAPEEGIGVILIIADGLGNPVDQLEAAKYWLEEHGLELARIITVVHCQLWMDHPALTPWYEACIHFSDVILLNRRENVLNKWISDFRHRLEKERHPGLVELVKKGKVDHPQVLLYPEPRRLSLYFDQPEPSCSWNMLEITALAPEQADEGEGTLDLQAEEEPVVEVYFERNPAGQRVKQIPDPAKILEKS